MATPHSIRSKANSSSRPRNRGVTASAPTRRYRTSCSQQWLTRPSAHARHASNTTLIPELRQMAHLLRAVYSSCHNSRTRIAGTERRSRTRHSLHMNVSDPISRQVESLDELPRPTGVQLGAVANPLFRKGFWIDGLVRFMLKYIQPPGVTDPTRTGQPPGAKAAARRFLHTGPQ